MIASAKSASCVPRGLFVSACAAFSLLLTGPLHAGPTPKNVDNGLDALLQANYKVELAKKTHTENSLPMFEGFGSKKAANMSKLAMVDGGNRYLVRIQPNGVVPVEELEERAVEKVPRMKIQATDYAYHGAGVFEAWVHLKDVATLCGLKGVSHVSLTPKPVNNRLKERLSDRVASAGARPVPAALNGEVLNIIGTVFDFGITQHRVDQINQTYNSVAPVDYEGQGMSIGDLSDSFDTSGSGSYATDVSTGDLPGTGNLVNGTPVFVLEDFSGGGDEGRAMCQTLFKMAPKASLAFATADDSEIDFANNIRSLANLPGYANSASFSADVICDDISYFDEPFFQDGIIAQGVNDVVDAGVVYCSSAANNAGTNGYDADFNFIPNDPTNSGGLTYAAGNTALANTNINLANVPPDLYAGGFQNFNASGTVAAGTTDVAQLVNYPDSDTLALYGEPTAMVPTILQWNDPADAATVTTSADPIFPADTGTLTYPLNTSTGISFTHPLTQGQEYYLLLVPGADSESPATDPLDGQITVLDPNGNQVSFTDNTGSGENEQVLFYAQTSGTYTFKITAYEDTTSDPPDLTDGSFTLYTYAAAAAQLVTNNLNLLVFDTNGNYLAADSSAGSAIPNGSPIDIVAFQNQTGETQVYFVIAKSNPTPSGSPNGVVSNHLRYLCFGDGVQPLGPAEYFSYTTPLTYGHSCAAGAMGVAAYPYYKPNIPEVFTSPGPSTQYFDADNNYIGKQVRLKPDIAAMDGANTTFFGSDGAQDEDSSPNFSGTSDACPHAAAIAALVLQANRGSGSMTPAQVKAQLQATAFPHDLDPYYAKGVARTTDGGKVTVIVKGDDQDETLGNSAAQGSAGNQDPNAITIQYVGPGSLTSFVFNPSGSVATAGNVTDGTNGITDAAPYTYFNQSTPGIIFSIGVKAFTVGTSVPSTLAAEATATQSNFVSLSVTHSFTLAITFPAGDFLGGDIFRFTFGRDEYNDADSPPNTGGAVNNGSADVVGGGVSIPDAAINTQVGMAFSGTTSTGATFGTTSPGLTSQTAFIRNRIGQGYSPLDGFGFIDAQTAVGQPFGDTGHVPSGAKKQPVPPQ